MSYSTGYDPSSVARTALEQRLGFLRKTYTHLFAAILIFVLLSALFHAAGVGEAILGVIAGSRFTWLLFIGAFALAGYLAQTLARSDRSLGTQYLGLGLYTIAEALIFTPLIFLASRFPGVLGSATIITLTTFVGLTGYVLIYNKDLSFLRSVIVVGGFTALGVIIAASIFGISLGTWFSGAMILFAVCAVLYSTSNVLNHYRVDQYVAAALDLFASVALLFWYVLSFLMSMQRR